jgi:phosphoserine phosphatase
LDCSDQPEGEITTVITFKSDCIRRFAPLSGQHRESLQAILKSYGVNNACSVPHIAGVLDALRVSYEGGYLATVSELIHAEMFSDFLEMAEYLLSEGYKDPAAVIAGSVLEEHLRRFASRSGIDANVGGKPKKADQLNADLAGRAVYSKLDQKSVTSWLDLRNRAAHGKYSEYSRDQVALYMQGIRDFIARLPA